MSDPAPRRSWLPWLTALQLVVGAATLAAAGWAVVRTEQLRTETAARLDRPPPPAGPPAHTGVPLLDVLAAPVRVVPPAADPTPAGKPAPPKAAPPPTFRSVAVLPFGYETRGDADREAKRLPAGLSVLLTRTDRFRVADPEKVEEALKKLGERDRADPRKAGRAAGVEAVLTGRLTTDGFGSLYLQAELIEVETGLPVWSRSYDLGHYFNTNAWVGGIGGAARKVVAEVEGFAVPPGWWGWLTRPR